MYTDPKLQHGQTHPLSHVKQTYPNASDAGTPSNGMFLNERSFQVLILFSTFRITGLTQSEQTSQKESFTNQQFL